MCLAIDSSPRSNVVISTKLLIHTRTRNTYEAQQISQKEHFGDRFQLIQFLRISALNCRVESLIVTFFEPQI